MIRGIKLLLFIGWLGFGLVVLNACGQKGPLVLPDDALGEKKTEPSDRSKNKVP